MIRSGRRARPRAALARQRGSRRDTQREDFTGVAVPFYEGHLRADTLPQFRAMNAAWQATHGG
jgi:hypothetical protein